MKYCRSCKRLHTDEMTRCTECGKKLREITDINEPVRLAVVGGTERAMLTGLLVDAAIPFIEQNIHPQGVANELVTGYDVKLNNINVLVPYAAIPEASGLVSTIETLDNSVEQYVDYVKEDIEKFKNNSFKEEKPMSPALRTTIKVVTAILFLIVLALVVFGTDKVMELIKGLFGG